MTAQPHMYVAMVNVLQYVAPTTSPVVGMLYVRVLNMKLSATAHLAHKVILEHNVLLLAVCLMMLALMTAVASTNAVRLHVLWTLV